MGKLTESQRRALLGLASGQEFDVSASEYLIAGELARRGYVKTWLEYRMGGRSVWKITDEGRAALEASE